VLDDNFDRALDIIADMFLKSSYDDVEMEKEKKVIVEEINMYEDTPEELVFEIMHSGVFGDTSIARPILGSIENVKSFTHEDIKKYYNKNYTTDRIVISVAGNFVKNYMINKIEKFFGAISKSADSNINSEENKIKYNKVILTKQKEIEQVHLCLGFPGVKTCLEQNYSLALLNTVFGNGMSSRLYQKIREENGLAYSVFSYNYSYESIGLFTIYAAVNPKNVEKCISIIMNEIKRLNSELITQDELNKAKEQLKANYLISLESSANVMSNLGKSFTIYNKILTPDEIVNYINKVELNDIKNLVESIFNLDLLSLSTISSQNYNFEEIIKNAI
jgi:predicted Zn-dependent peptidase